MSLHCFLEPLWHLWSPHLSCCLCYSFKCSLLQGVCHSQQTCIKDLAFVLHQMLSLTLLGLEPATSGLQDSSIDWTSSASRLHSAYLQLLFWLTVRYSSKGLITQEIPKWSGTWYLQLSFNGHICHHDAAVSRTSSQTAAVWTPTQTPLSKLDTP